MVAVRFQAVPTLGKNISLISPQYLPKRTGNKGVEKLGHVIVSIDSAGSLLQYDNVPHSIFK